MKDGQWWDKSITLVEGCTPVSAGCAHCWSATITHRFHQDKGLTTNGHYNGKIICRGDRLDEILRRKKPTRWVIWNDLFHPFVKFEFIDKVVATFEQCPEHTFQILTKRPDYLLAWSRAKCAQRYLDICKNIWLGVTVEHPDYKDRIDILRRIPAAVRFLSIEPCLGDMGELNLDGISQVILGCESLGGRVGRLHIPDLINNPMSGVKISAENIWRKQATEIVNQCKAAGVSVFVKQIPINGKVSHEMSEWPAELRVRQLPQAKEPE